LVSREEREAEIDIFRKGSMDVDKIDRTYLSKNVENVEDRYRDLYRERGQPY
jgi:hypothetical protein